MAFVRTVKTGSGATAVQIVWSTHAGARDIEHLGSAHDAARVELLKTAGAKRITAGQHELPFATPRTREPQALRIVSSTMGRLLDSIGMVYRELGFDAATGHDKVFQDLVTARIIEPSSKQDAARVLSEVGVRAMSYRTVKRRLPVYAGKQWRARLSRACAAAAGLGPASLLLYDVSTLWFETDEGDGFREPGFSNYAACVVMPSVVVLVLVVACWSVVRAA